MPFKVRDMEGNDITDRQEWYMNPKGELFYLTNDVDSPLAEADECWIEML